MNYRVENEDEMKAFGARLGTLLRGGTTIELTGDVGAGKTTLVKGIARGLGVDEDVQSPSFTISRLYSGTNDVRLAHYDFYRLQDSGIMADELSEAASDPQVVTVVEWAEIVGGVMPEDRLTLRIESPGETVRSIDIQAGGSTSRRILEQLS